jgi:hypothetical protein
VTNLVSFDQLTAASAPRLRDHIAHTVLDGTDCLLDQHSGWVGPLLPTEHLALQFMDGTVTLGELADDLGAVLSADPAAIREDLVSMARGLGSRGFLDRVEYIESAILSTAEALDGTPAPDDGSPEHLTVMFSP